MSLQPKIETLSEKKLIGFSLEMTLAQPNMGLLWKNFKPRLKEITNNLNSDLISMSQYSENYFLNFNPTHTFQKWAAIEVADLGSIPEGLQSVIVPRGLYAIFHYKGSSADTSIFDYIFRTWLPNSMYELDHRPHFEVLGEKYKNNDPESEEDIYIPIRLKKST